MLPSMVSPTAEIRTATDPLAAPPVLIEPAGAVCAGPVLRTTGGGAEPCTLVTAQAVRPTAAIAAAAARAMAPDSVMALMLRSPWAADRSS
ncbi:MAG TPA: hypothetical protein VME70_06445 [Mycobacteriales bacterium]|nr:hypothetical protein [Mycobacteriales bacterium]